AGCAGAPSRAAGYRQALSLPAPPDVADDDGLARGEPELLDLDAAPGQVSEDPERTDDEAHVEPEPGTLAPAAEGDRLEPLEQAGGHWRRISTIVLLRRPRRRPNR